jgi:hypothetical protein
MSLLKNDTTMSDTPETDAALYPMNGVDIVWPEFARELERERDEAIRARDVALKAAHTYDEAHTKACEGWAQAERERDDLRDRLNDLLNRPALV